MLKTKYAVKLINKQGETIEHIFDTNSERKAKQVAKENSYKNSPEQKVIRVTRNRGHIHL